MIVRHTRPSDQDQVYDCFVSAQITAALAKERGASSGFYEYPLSYNDIAQRTQNDSSLVMLDSNGRIISYLLAYSVRHAQSNLATLDAVHIRLSNESGDAMYLDQLFLKPGWPIYTGMRLMDSWDLLARNEHVPQVFTAIPMFPWRNKSSERLVAFRGYKRIEFVEEPAVKLGLFEKPHYDLN